MKVLCLGHVVWDTTILVDEYPIENSKNRFNDYIECGGGQASNAAYLLGKWGVDVAIGGIVGNDTNGHKIEKELIDAGVDTRYLELNDNLSTISSYVTVNKNSGSRTTLTYHPNNLKLTKEIDQDYDILLIDGQEYDMALKMIDKCKISVIDAGRCTDEVVDLCKKVDYVVCSLEFATTYTNKKIEQLDEIFDIMLSDFKNVIITLEEKGCAYYQDGVKVIPTLKVEAVDSTGAGDIFHGAFVYGLMQNWELPKILVFANITGALSVTKFGGRNSVYPLDQVRSIANEFVRSNIY